MNDINEALKKVNFPVDVWRHYTDDDSTTANVEFNGKNLENWDDIYLILGVKNPKKTIMDFHPFNDSTKNKLNFVIANPKDLYEWRTEEAFDKYMMSVLYWHYSINQSFDEIEKTKTLRPYYTTIDFTYIQKWKK